MSNIDKPKDNNQLLKDILNELTARNPNIFSAMIVSDEGLNVASGIPHDKDDSFALVTSDLMDMAQDFCNRLEQGNLNRILLEGGERTTVITRAGQRTILVVLIPATTKLGVIALSMRRAADQVTAIFS